jgi:glycosyltransferase involved in cell wall biosynthesis
VTRVLVVGLRYPPHHTGGYEVACRDVAEGLVDRGHEVVVLTSDLRQPGVVDPEHERHARVPVRRDLKAWFRAEALYAPGPMERWRMERTSQAALREALDEVQPDVVFVWQMGALSLGLLTTVARRGIPIVYAVFDDWLSYAPELDAWSRAFRRLPAPLARAVGAVLRLPTVAPDVGPTGVLCFISDVTRARAEALAPSTTPDTTIVYCGIDGRLFTPDDPPRPRDGWEGRLLYVGRYDPRKGIETAVRAMAHLPGATLEVQGTGDLGERDRLAAVAADLGVADRVRFGAVDRAGLVARYRAADAVVFPSEWEEPFGLVPLEAMACGAPVVATGVGGSGEYLLDGVNCVRFREGDPVALAAAVERVAGDRGLRRRLVDRGAATAAAFDVERLTDCFEAWLTGAASGFAGGRPADRSFHLDGDDVRA